MEKNFKISQKQTFFLIGQINGSKSCSVYGSKNLIDLCESSWNENAKIGIGFVSSSNTSRENRRNAFSKKTWIH